MRPYAQILQGCVWWCDGVMNLQAVAVDSPVTATPLASLLALDRGKAMPHSSRRILTGGGSKIAGHSALLTYFVL